MLPVSRDVSDKEVQKCLQQLAQAAESCGISRATFRREINRLKRDDSCSV